jgi:hypothetical protein
LSAAAVLAPVALPFVGAAGLVAGGLLVREREHWRAEHQF